MKKTKAIFQTMKPAMLLKADFTTYNVTPENGKTFTFKELKEGIGGGYVGISPLPNNLLLICDEDGRSKQLELNINATELCRKYGISYLVGDIMIIHTNQLAKS